MVSQEEAFLDVAFFFSVLKYGYAGCEYYGADEKSTEAKGKIETELAKTPAKIAVGDFSCTLYKHLEFIEDGHFLLGSRQLRQAQAMHMNFEYAFSRDENGFYLNLAGNKEYIREVNGGEPAEFIWPSLDENGQVIFRVGMLSPMDQGGLSCGLLLGSNDAPRKLRVSLKRITPGLLEPDQFIGVLK